jgi:hypothetical protein
MFYMYKKQIKMDTYLSKKLLNLHRYLFNNNGRVTGNITKPHIGSRYGF